MTHAISDAARSRVRAQFEADQVDAITVQRGQPGTLDPETGQVTGLVAARAIYAGKARITPVSSTGDVELGEGEIPQRQCTAQVPWTVDQVRINDLVTITAQRDPDLVGTTWRVAGVDGGGAWMAKRDLSLVGWYPGDLWDGTRDGH